MPSASPATAVAPKPSATPTQPPWEPHPMRPLIVRLPDDWDFSDEAMLKLWDLNPQWDIEVTEAGELSIMPGTGWTNSAAAMRIGAASTRLE